MSNKFYNELKIFVNNYEDQIADFIMSFGIEAIEYEKECLVIRSEDELQNLKYGVEEFIKKLSEIFNEDIRVSFELNKKENQDWISKYQNSIKPIEVGGFYIHPSWEESKQNLINIIINPALAFGSGHHESTYSCLKMIEKYLKKDDRVLDVGCGSGILSIACAKLGAVVDSCDTDEQALQSTHENEKLNSVKLNKTWVGSVGEAKESYDVVVANIIADILIIISKDLIKALKPNATLILSGILDKYEKRVLDSFQDLRHLQTYEKNEWRTIIFIKGEN